MVIAPLPAIEEGDLGASATLYTSIYDAKGMSIHDRAEDTFVTASCLSSWH